MNPLTSLENASCDVGPKLWTNKPQERTRRSHLCHPAQCSGQSLTPLSIKSLTFKGKHHKLAAALGLVAGAGAFISNLPRRFLALFGTHFWSRRLSLLLSRESREEMLLGGEWLKDPRNKAWEQEGARGRKRPLSRGVRPCPLRTSREQRPGQGSKGNTTNSPPSSFSMCFIPSFNVNKFSKVPIPDLQAWKKHRR